MLRTRARYAPHHDAAGSAERVVDVECGPETSARRCGPTPALRRDNSTTLRPTAISPSRQGPGEWRLFQVGNGDARAATTTQVLASPPRGAGQCTPATPSRSRRPPIERLPMPPGASRGDERINSAPDREAARAPRRARSSVQGHRMGLTNLITTTASMRANGAPGTQTLDGWSRSQAQRLRSSSVRAYSAGTSPTTPPFVAVPVASVW